MAGVDVFNEEALVERFGEWPSFHDAEIYGVRLDSGQRADGVVRLELDIHVFAVDGVRPDGHLNYLNHTLVTLEFEEVEALELDGFGHQNVLFDLKLEEVNLAAGRQIEVELSSSHGLAGGFRCRTATVLAAVPMTPGEHSVYRA
jgi:Immunity protein 50